VRVALSTVQINAEQSTQSVNEFMTRGESEQIG